MIEFDPSRVVITLDSNWAPAFVVEDVFSRISCWDVPTTCFLTDALKCSAPAATEIGVHMNFLPGSTQGTTKREVISNVRTTFPDAVSVRSHGLYWDDELPSLLKASGFEFDSSLKGLFEDGLAPNHDGDLIRVPYWWSDVFHLTQGIPLSRGSLESRMATPGLKVFKFHMMYVWLNCCSQDDWQSVRAVVGDDLNNTPKAKLSKFCRDGPGIGTLFFELLEWLDGLGRTAGTIARLRDGV